MEKFPTSAEWSAAMRESLYGVRSAEADRYWAYYREQEAIADLEIFAEEVTKAAIWAVTQGGVKL